MNPTQGGWLILLTIVFAMVLSIVHLPQSWPEWLASLRPAWVALVVFFWVLELPHRIGLIAAWLVGLALDVLYADPLGLNGLLLATLTFVAWRFYERLRMYSVLQHCGLLFVLLLAGELVRMLVQNLAWERGVSWQVVLPALMSALVWPFVYFALQRLRTQLHVR